MSTKRQRIGYWKYTHGYVKNKPMSKAEIYANIIVFGIWIIGLILLVIFCH